MPKFRVEGQVTISISVVVDARDKDHADAKAIEDPMQDFCQQCCCNAEEDVWTFSGELDGPAQILEVTDL